MIPTAELIEIANGLPCMKQERPETYHAQADHYLSSHRLAEFRRCPEYYHRMQQGLVDRPDSAAYRLGRAAHTRILEGAEEFAARYAVGGPVNPSTGRPYGTATKAYADWAEEQGAQGREVLTEAAASQVERMAFAIFTGHQVAIDLLAVGVAERVVRAPLLDVPCQARIDWFNPRHGIVDLKTCEDLDRFEGDARRFGYVHQLAFYRAVLRAGAGETYPVHIIAVEKKEPYRAGVWHVPGNALDFAEVENAAAMRDLKQCVASGNWPTGYERVRELEL